MFYTPSHVLSNTGTPLNILICIIYKLLFRLYDLEDNINAKYKIIFSINITMQKTKNLLPSGSKHPECIPMTILKGLEKFI